MQIMGLQKMTLLDYPGYVAATIFTGGCNFRCPFCQNASLVNMEEEIIDEAYIFKYLAERKKYLDGVCITGGEPTLQKGLIDFIRKIKNMGYKVKLDTNGTNSQTIEILIDQNLLDFVSMDIKNSKEKYSLTSGANVDLLEIEKTIALLKKSNIDYEFRTTIVYEFHNEKDIEDISIWLKGSKKYVLQQFQDSGKLIQDGLHAHSNEKLIEFKKIFEKNIDNVQVRGI